MSKVEKTIGKCGIVEKDLSEMNGGQWSYVNIHPIRVTYI
jgi:hypothetical protein